MRTHFVLIVIVPVMTFAACGSTPGAVEAKQARSAISPTKAASTNKRESVVAVKDAGLGVIIYDELTRNPCSRTARPGSRIHRPSCDTADPSVAITGDFPENAARAPINQRRVAK